jgi:PAS domain S-box-containing protein
MTFTDTSTPDSGDSPQPRCATSYSWDGTLVVDELGNIHGCGEAAGQLFGVSHGKMIGRPVSAFIVGVLFEGCSLGETARQLARLCSEHDWQRFTGLDVHGHSFPVEVNVTRKMIERRAVFLFNLRRSGSV